MFHRGGGGRKKGFGFGGFAVKKTADEGGTAPLPLGRPAYLSKRPSKKEE